MLNTKLRKFRFEDNKIIMCGSKESGEFIHINDIELLLREEKRMMENMKAAKSHSDNQSEWDKKFIYGLDEKIEFVEHLLNTI